MRSIDNDLKEALRLLNDGKPKCLADILYPSQLPLTGSEDDVRVRILEEELIKQNLVVVTEKGGTSKTINGYYYFVISAKGKLKISESNFIKNDKRILCALSTTDNDSNLINSGLKNRGLLGFLETAPKEETYEFIKFNLIFPNGIDFFYTLDTSNEKLANLKPMNLGILGYARKTKDASYHQLYRFFNDKHQTHLYVINPNIAALESDNYHDESIRNPIYIKRNDFGLGDPLYFYSNSNTEYFTPLEQEDESPSISLNNLNDLQMDLIDRLRKRKIPNAIYNVNNENPDSFTIGINSTFLNFYVNRQKNGKYYTVRRNPQSELEPYIVHDIDDPHEISDKFESWLKDIEFELLELDAKARSSAIIDSVSATESSVAFLSRRIYSQTNISIGDSHEIEPAIGVEQLADEIVKIIKNLKPEAGNMTGIFAPWGRGKTRLMKEIWNRLCLIKNKKQKIWQRLKKICNRGSINHIEIEYIKVEYQAWRYQDTPASWAYLYEQFSLAFLGNKKTIKSFFKYHIRLFKLNVERNGIWNLIVIMLFVGLAIFGILIFNEGKVIIKSLIASITIPFVGFILISIVRNFRLDYFSKATNLIKKYGLKTNFDEILGIQAEIQKELVYLINAWLPKEDKKLVLFVDDLDRCKPEKIIEIIDALRIMLDDEKIKNKLLVITAIDEHLLQLAIREKYDKSIPSELAREYIDKLFIFSLKLGPLTEKDSQEFFEKLIKDEVAIEEQSQSVEDASPTDIYKPTGIPNEPNETDQQPNSDKVKVNIKIDKIDKLTETEKVLILKFLHLMQNATPRKIRILYYRYLFVRNLLILKDFTQNENCYWLQEPFHEVFVQQLIYYSQQPPEFTTNQWKEFNKFTSEEITPDVGLGISQKIKKSEYLKLLKIFELAIAY